MSMIKELENDKVVRASDANPIKRFLKKTFGQQYLEDMTDAQLQRLIDRPNSVFGKLKVQGMVGSERSRRKSLLDKAYKDKIIRDQQKSASFASRPPLTEAQKKKLNMLIKAYKDKQKND
jgi:hypothetical protein|tara:strand:+ start:2451 stop:2810 length:360 start_codon:yes stop_codon:yes gene_type:complete